MKVIKMSVIFAVLFILASCKQQEPIKGGYKVVWQENFEDSTKLEKHWSKIPRGKSDWNEYMSDYDGLYKIEGGNLILKGIKNTVLPNDDVPYLTGGVYTKGKIAFDQGRIEIKARLFGARGAWPAIWMLPTDWVYGGWPASGEIDIMEHVGYNQNTIHASTHSEAYYHSIGTQKTATKYVDGVSDDFHVYAVEWLPDKVHGYIDGELYFTFDPQQNKSTTTYKEWPFDQRFHLLINIAVGGNWGAAQGFDDSIYPVQMEVDYVRVYQSKEINELTGQ